MLKTLEKKLLSLKIKPQNQTLVTLIFSFSIALLVLFSLLSRVSEKRDGCRKLDDTLCALAFNKPIAKNFNDKFFLKDRKIYAVVEWKNFSKLNVKKYPFIKSEPEPSGFSRLWIPVNELINLVNEKTVERVETYFKE